MRIEHLHWKRETLILVRWLGRAGVLFSEAENRPEVS